MRTLIHTGLLVAFSVAAFACSEDAKVAAPEKKPKAPKEMSILPENVYSGFDGRHPFQAPVAIYESSSDLTVTAEDPSAVEVKPTELTDDKSKGVYFMLTVKREGVHKIVARSKGKEKVATLTATKYEVADWNAGEKRYASPSVSGDPPCTQCHRDGAIDHSPATLAAVNDATVNTVITDGMTVFGSPIEINGQPGHKWALNDGDRKMLVTYLRGLPPRGFK